MVPSPTRLGEESLIGEDWAEIRRQFVANVIARAKDKTVDVES